MNVSPPVPEIWLSWPCSIYALPGEFSQYALQLDTLGELDNEAVALKVDLRSRVARFTQRFRAEFGNYDGWVKRLLLRRKPSSNVWLQQFRENLAALLISLCLVLPNPNRLLKCSLRSLTVGIGP